MSMLNFMGEFGLSRDADWLDATSQSQHLGSKQPQTFLPGIP